MATTLDDLEKRIAQVEQEIAAWRQRMESFSPVETPAQRGARLLRDAGVHQTQLSATWAKAMEEMGIKGTPISAESMQKMMTDYGMKPEANELSQDIVKMREE